MTHHQRASHTSTTISCTTSPNTGPNVALHPHKFSCNVSHTHGDTVLEWHTIPMPIALLITNCHIPAWWRFCNIKIIHPHTTRVRHFSCWSTSPHQCLAKANAKGWPPVTPTRAKTWNLWHVEHNSYPLPGEIWSQLPIARGDLVYSYPSPGEIWSTVTHSQGKYGQQTVAC